MNYTEVNSKYFDWLFDMVCRNRYPAQNSFRKLLMHLHDIDFRYMIANDQNRASDGVRLRYRFALYLGYDDDPKEITNLLSGPCSVLEMMVGLAVRCEEDIMDDASKGNRTGQWFWEMIVSLGLGSMDDRRYDERVVDDVIECFLNRDYKPNGKGGLFTIDNTDQDLRIVEIWYQMCWYLDNFT